MNNPFCLSQKGLLMHEKNACAETFFFFKPSQLLWKYYQMACLFIYDVFIWSGHIYPPMEVSTKSYDRQQLKHTMLSVYQQTQNQKWGCTASEWVTPSIQHRKTSQALTVKSLQVYDEYICQPRAYRELQVGRIMISFSPFTPPPKQII